MSAVSSTGATGSAADYSQGTSPVKGPTVDKNMFLQLLVAQLRNQDPMNPTDGTAFVGQLAQFQQLEQSINTGQDIAAIRKSVDTLLAASSAVATQS